MNWRASDQRAREDLTEYHQSFPARTEAVREFVCELIASGKLRRPRLPAPPINDGEDYTHPRTGEVMRDGMLSPGT